MLSVLLTLPILLSAQQNVNIGDIVCTDGSIVKPELYASSGKTANGIVFYVDSSNQHGWAVSLRYQGYFLWCPYTNDVPSLQNYRKFKDAITDTDGYNNTQKIRQAGDENEFPAAFSVDFSSGWYLPAAGQIRFLYGYIPEINSSIAITGGDAFELTSDWWLWSSTECDSESAWDINYLGDEGHSKKNGHYFLVRQVRNF